MHSSKTLPQNPTWGEEAKEAGSRAGLASQPVGATQRPVSRQLRKQEIQVHSGPSKIPDSQNTPDNPEDNVS